MINSQLKLHDVWNKNSPSSSSSSITAPSASLIINLSSSIVSSTDLDCEIEILRKDVCLKLSEPVDIIRKKGSTNDVILFLLETLIISAIRQHHQQQQKIMCSTSSLDSFDKFTNNFSKEFSHQPCIVIGIAQSNLPPSPWSGKDNRNTQLCCQPFFDPNSNGGRYEIAFYDNGYAYYEALDGTHLRGRLERMNPQMEFRDVRKVLEKMKNIFEQSVTNKADNQISVQLINDDLLLVDVKGLVNGSIPFKYMFKCLRREGEFYEANYVRQIVYCLAERRSRELELIKIIQAKDKELDDYRSQGTCQLQRGWLATQPFDKDEFDKSTSRQVQQRHDDVLMHTLDLAFDREGQQLIEECLLRNEYLKRTRSSHDGSSSSTSKTAKKTASPHKRSLVKTNSGSSQSLNDDIVAAERRRHEELEKQLQLAKERDEQIAKKKKKKFV